MKNFEIIEDLSTFNNWTKSYRYKTYHAQRDGKEYLVKYPQDKAHRRMVKNEVRFREFFEQVEIPKVTCTKIVEVTDTYVVFEWIEAPLLGERAGPYDDFQNEISRYATLLVAMDKAAEGYVPSSDDTEAVSAYSKRNMSEEQLSQQLREHIAAGYLSTEDIHIFTREYQGCSHIERRYQHGDLAPWQIFIVGEQWQLFDAEHANTGKDRFFDLAHTYARFATICHRPDLARELLSEFVNLHDSFNGSEQEQFMRVMVEQSLSELINSYNDRESVDYKNEARELFDSVSSLDFNKIS